MGKYPVACTRRHASQNRMFSGYIDRHHAQKGRLWLTTVSRISGVGSAGEAAPPDQDSASEAGASPIRQVPSCTEAPAIMLVIGFIIMAAIAFMVLRFVLTMLYLFLFR